MREVGGGLAVVVPVYDGAPVLAELFAAIEAIAPQLPPPLSVVFVDDASRDASWQTIAALHARHGGARIRGVRLAHNAGQQAATLCGLLEAAAADWIATVDDDLQTPPAALAALLAHAEATDADLVYGELHHLQHAPVHRAGSHLFRALSRLLAPHAPPASSLRLLRGELVRRLPPELPAKPFVDPLLSAVAARIGTVPVRHAASRLGRSRYSTGALVALAGRALASRLLPSAERGTTAGRTAPFTIAARL